MTSSRRIAVQAGGLLLAGALTGGVLAATIGASASTPSATPAADGTYAAGPGYGGPDRHGMYPFAPMTAGTVQSVGTDSVTITSAAGTKTYQVGAHSDIDKNGEATLSDLRAGDAVHFAVRPVTSTIAVLHAGDEAKDTPAFGGRHHGRGPCPGMGPGGPGGPAGTRPAPNPSASTSSGT